MTKINPPYLSIVVTARNDDHGGNLLNRMQIFINGLIEQCNRYKLDSELIIVEWNPPEDRVRLVEALSFPQNNAYCSIRIIEVPPKIHTRFKYSDKLELFQMIAKNVGIRRAKGKFVLATNIDIIFSNKLIEFIASRKLKKDKFYRVDRYDVSANIPLNADIEEQLKFCKQNIIRINTSYGTFKNNVIYQRIYNSWLFQKILLLFKTIIVMIVFPFEILSSHPQILLRIFKSHEKYKELHSDEWGKQSIPWRIKYYKRLIIQLFSLFLPQTSSILHLPRLHTNACGDFTLMAKEHWVKLRGYPEFEMYSLHIDSVLLYMAYYNSIKERILPYPIYHIEHKDGWSPEGAADLAKYLQEKGVPKMSVEELEDIALKMKKEHRVTIFNNENWGLINEDLPEITIC